VCLLFLHAQQQGIPEETSPVSETEEDLEVEDKRETHKENKDRGGRPATPPVDYEAFEKMHVTKKNNGSAARPTAVMY